MTKHKRVVIKKPGLAELIQEMKSITDRSRVSFRPSETGSGLAFAFRDVAAQARAAERAIGGCGMSSNDVKKLREDSDFFGDAAQALEKSRSKLRSWLLLHPDKVALYMPL
jgi:hypothetical protein